jgi:hypothetical protein
MHREVNALLLPGTPLKCGWCATICVVLLLLQGGVPLPVYNTVSMMMPMNLQRVKMAAAKLKPEEKAAMQQRQLQIVAASKAEAAAAAAGGKGSKGGKKAK